MFARLLHERKAKNGTQSDPVHFDLRLLAAYHSGNMTPPMRVMRLMALMKHLVDADSQFVVSTHSPMLMAFPGADVVEVADDGLRRVDYRDTDHYQVMLHFLENPEQMLSYLLDE